MSCSVQSEEGGHDLRGADMEYLLHSGNVESH